MSDSRITSTVMDIKAAAEVTARALLRLDELLREDPAFGFDVSDNLSSALDYVARGDTSIRLGLQRLLAADKLENQGVA